MSRCFAAHLCTRFARFTPCPCIAAAVEHTCRTACGRGSKQHALNGLESEEEKRHGWRSAHLFGLRRGLIRHCLAAHSRVQFARFTSYHCLASAARTHLRGVSAGRWQAMCFEWSYKRSGKSGPAGGARIHLRCAEAFDKLLFCRSLAYVFCRFTSCPCIAAAARTYLPDRLRER